MKLLNHKVSAEVWSQSTCNQTNTPKKNWTEESSSLLDISSSPPENKLRFITLRFRAFNSHFCPKRLTVFHTHVHSYTDVLTSTSGAVWDSVSCPRTLQHSGQGNWTSDLPITSSYPYPWATAVPDSWFMRHIFRYAERKQMSCYREVTLSMPILRSSRVQAVRIVATSMLPLLRILPDVFRRWRVNSPSLRLSWCCRSDGCTHQEQSDTRSNNQRAETGPADPYPDDPEPANPVWSDLGRLCQQLEWQTEQEL